MPSNRPNLELASMSIQAKFDPNPLSINFFDKIMSGCKCFRQTDKQRMDGQLENSTFPANFGERCYENATTQQDSFG